MSKYKAPHRLLLDYNKICFNCRKTFYCKDKRVIYCSDECREIGQKLKQKWNARAWHERNKEHIRNYQREKYAKKKKNK